MTGTGAGSKQPGHPFYFVLDLIDKKNGAKRFSKWVPMYQDKLRAL
jgi:hypothetical protein